MMTKLLVIIKKWIICTGIFSLYITESYGIQKQQQIHNAKFCHTIYTHQADISNDTSSTKLSLHSHTMFTMKSDFHTLT